VVDDIEISGEGPVIEDKRLAANDKKGTSEWRRMTGADGHGFVP
jgi:hypothetical protein